MDAVQALKIQSAQLELDAITGGGGNGHEKGESVAGDIDSEWDDGRLGRGTQSAEHTVPSGQNSGWALREGHNPSPPAQSNRGTVTCQDSLDPRHEDPTAALLSGMLFQQLSESRGGAVQNSESMAATIKNVLIATGIAVDDADIGAPLDYVEEMFAQLGLGVNKEKKGRHATAGAIESQVEEDEEKPHLSLSQKECAEQPKDADCRSEVTPQPQPFSPSKQPQQRSQPQFTHQNDSQRILQNNLSQNVPDSVRVPTAPWGPPRGGSDMPSAHLPAGPQQWHVPSTAQAIRNVHYNSSALHMQQAHLLAQRQGQASPQHCTYDAWDAAARSRFVSGSMRPEALTQVAAAAAVAAAQAVKSDSDSELSQVLKAVLLQQSSLGMQRSALAATVAAPAAQNTTQQTSTPLQVPPSAVPVVRSMSRVPLPQPYSAAPSSPPSLGASHLAPGPHCDVVVDAADAEAPPPERLQPRSTKARSHNSAQHSALTALKSGEALKGNAQGGVQPVSEEANPKSKPRAARSVPHRLKGSVSSTPARTPATRPCTPATQPTSPAAPISTESGQPAAGHILQSLAGGTMQQPTHSDDPPLHPAFEASVDAARASVCPELAAARPTLELPQPDFAGKARCNLKRMLGDDMSYIDIKCAARSAATEAHTELMAFKRSIAAAAPLVSTRMLPSWHSMEAMDDVGVFADACVQEVALRASQVQSDVSDGVYDLSHSRARTFRSQAVARSLQQLTAKQALALPAGDKKDANAVALLGSPECGNSHGAHAANRVGAGAAVPGEKRHRVNPGRKAGRSSAADEQAGVRAPLQDGSNVKRGEMDTTALRAQAAYERAVDRGRARPPIAFGRRLEDAARGQARSDAKENGQHAAGPGIDAADPAVAGGKMGRAPGRPNSGSIHHRFPDEGKEPHESDRQEARVPQQNSQRGSYMHEHPVLGGTDEWDHEWEGPQSGLGGRGANSRPLQHTSQFQGAAAAHTVDQPNSSSTETDAALVALLQGLTEIIRANNLAPPPTMLAPQPAWPTHAAPQQPTAAPQQMPEHVASAAPKSQHVGADPESTAAVRREDQPANMRHADARAGHGPATTSSAASPADGSLQDQLSSAQCTAATSPVQSSKDRPTVATVAALARHLADRRSQGAVHPRSASATAAWAALGYRTPPRFLSVVDIAAPSTDQDCSSDGGRTSAAHGEFLHGVDVAALEDLIAASTHVSEQGDGQGCTVTLTQEEAAILKAVVKDLTSANAHSTASIGIKNSGQRVDDAGVPAAPKGECAGENLSEAAPGENAESVLTMQQSALANISQSPYRDSGRESAGSTRQGSGGGVLPSHDVDALPAGILAESGEVGSDLHITAGAQSAHDGIRGDLEAEHGSACGGLPGEEAVRTTQTSGCDGAVQHLPPCTAREQANSHVHDAPTTDAAVGNPANEDGDCQDQQHTCEGHVGPPEGRVEHVSMARSVSSRDGGSSHGAQLAGVSTRATLQERIKERYAELRQQTKAALDDSSTCDNSPERSLQPRAPPLHPRRRSNSPNTPTDLSIASVSFDPSRVYRHSALSRPPPLASSTEHSVRSSDAGDGLVQHGLAAASKVATPAAVPSSMQAEVDGPYIVPVGYEAHSHQSGYPQEAAARDRTSGNISTSESPLPALHSWYESRQDTSRSRCMDVVPTDICAASSAAVDKDGGISVPSAIQDLLRPLAATTDDWKISSARPGLEQYSNLRCRLWRPPDDTQIFAAAVDYGQPSDVSGYCTEDSKYLSSTCADPPEHLPLALDRSLLRRRRLDRLKRRLKQESSFATTTSLGSSSDITASMSHESDLLH